MKYSSLFRNLLKADRRLDYIGINQGRILSLAQHKLTSSDIRDYEFKVFSQWGEDGIIQFLVNNIDVKNKTFIEFGVEDFTESNCRFLMMKDNWSGFVIDGSPKNISSLRDSYYYWMFDLTSVSSFITRENISYLLEKSQFHSELGILSIDLDGVDYHIFEALGAWRPSILIFEYNGTFGSKAPVTVPYADDFVRRKAHFSNQYWGASLPAFQHLAEQRGYGLVGVNSVGSNAFFVRRDLLNDRVKEVKIEGVFREANFRDSRDSNGRLNFLSKTNRRQAIGHLPLLNVVTGEILTVSQLPPE